MSEINLMKYIPSFLSCSVIISILLSSSYVHTCGGRNLGFNDDLYRSRHCATDLCGTNSAIFSQSFSPYKYTADNNFYKNLKRSNLRKVRMVWCLSDKFYDLFNEPFLSRLILRKRYRFRLNSYTMY